MLDFNPVREKRASLDELVDGFGPHDLRALTNEMIDAMQTLIADCGDADVIRMRDDLEAFDRWAATSEEISLPWTLGHVIAHTTASAEESAFLAAELARGIPHRGGRSRREAPWRQVTTIAQCRHRLEESRRMRLASLEMWPDEPDLDTKYSSSEGSPSMNAVGRFVRGLMHDDDHLGQIARLAAGD